MPPAFNLSQDQTLQFKVCSCSSQPILLTQDHIGFDVILSSIFGLRQNSTEHPHKLPDHLVKERATYRQQRPPILPGPPWLSTPPSTFLPLPAPARPAAPSRERELYADIATGQLLFSPTPFRLPGPYRPRLTLHPVPRAACGKRAHYRGFVADVNA